ncbi:DUF2971 domain-containing protein [Lutibacter sp.]|uniref:DUF2971 domain-containing protein n=1 Tax=Lutibacter sp. TaxID=1925666 RepID=UPI0027326E94|nr:DUF2971 domain-containing protein [Lutibacter sp.]MDP3313133.1 DUF2971 domain-containing protein [Lutibacter sp.]
MKNLNTFLKDIYCEDIIFHYTKTATAIDYILFNNRLKLTHIKASTDPIEKFPRYGIYSSWYGDKTNSDEMHKQHSEQINKMLENVETRIKDYVQVCFCKNKLQTANFWNFSIQYEDFGFAKPRMWEQYGDNYTGVCIAFSKKKIIEKNNNLELIKKGNSDVEYLTYYELSLKTNDVSVNSFNEIGSEDYEKKMIDRIENELFWKHKDYIDENEYKICTLFKKEQSCLNMYKNQLDHYMGLNIENSIKAIFVSSYANENQKKTLDKYSKEFDIPLIEIKWKNNGIETYYYDRFQELIESIEKKVIKKSTN